VRRNGLYSLLGILAVTVGLLIATIAAGFRPLLGIDLTGGVEVVLIASDDPDRTEPVTAEELDQATDIIRNRIEALDVAQPDITRQGGRVVVQLPDVEDQQRAIELVGQTAELRFRPVCAGPLPVEPVEPGALVTEEAPAEEEEAPVEDTPEGEAPAEEGDTPVEEAPEEQDPAAEEGAPADEVVEDSADEQGFVGLVEGETAAAAFPSQDPEPTAEPEPSVEADPTVEPEPSVEAEPTADTPAEDPAAEEEPVDAPLEEGTEDAPVVAEELDPLAASSPVFCNLSLDEVLALPTTDPSEDRRDDYVMLEQLDNDGVAFARHYLGPTLATGAALEGAEAFFTGLEWLVLPTFKPGADGIDLFNDAAALCFAQDIDVCPTGQLSTVLDSRVESALGVNAPFFQRDSITITGNFTEDRARDTALVLNFGALPVQLEQERARSVSSTLGSDSLRAGIVSGLIGLTLVALYMLLYYRLLGLAALLSLIVSGSLLWVIVSFLSETAFLFDGVTLTVAGVVGLIVSIGVSLDSNVVYFEHLKEDVAHGRTLRSSVDRAFPAAFRTVFWANMASLIGAAILYWLTEASVREFALMLGLASILDLVATYWFLRPLVRLMSRTDALTEHPGRFGLPPDRSSADRLRPAEVDA